MKEQKTHLENGKVVMAEVVLPQGLCLNDQTIENLIRYLQGFPKGSKVIIHHDSRAYDCQICCNFEHQKETKTAQLMCGFALD